MYLNVSILQDIDLDEVSYFFNEGNQKNKEK